MPPLKATQAREINKADIVEAETLVFEGRVLSQTGKQSMEPGEFYFRPTAVPVTIKPNRLQRLFGKKENYSHNTVDTVVIACPYCGLADHHEPRTAPRPAQLLSLFSFHSPGPYP